MRAPIASETFMDGDHGLCPGIPPDGGGGFKFRGTYFEGVIANDVPPYSLSFPGRFIVRDREVQLTFDPTPREEASTLVLHYRNIGGVAVLLTPEELAMYEREGRLERRFWVLTSEQNPYYLAHDYPKFAAKMPEWWRQEHVLSHSRYLRMRWGDFRERLEARSKWLPQWMQP